MATCKLLKDEGTDLLYGNTIEIRLGKKKATVEDYAQHHHNEWDAYNYLSPGPLSCMAVALGRSYSFMGGELPVAITSKITKVHVSVYGLPGLEDTRESNFNDLGLSINNVARLLRKTSAWRHIDIELMA